ncbi:MAG: HipA domain-containing protein [bacterium]
MADKKVYVYINLSGKDYLVGEMWSHFSKNKETSSFEYSNEWLNRQDSFSLEPNLFLGKGKQLARKGIKIFGAFGDSAPDTWGRILMRRYEAKLAKEENRPIKTLNEIDYLLGVNDEARQGALRFKEAAGADFLFPSSIKSIPPLVYLPKLLAAADKVEANDEKFEDIRLLLLPGSSLGGARPKASVIDKAENLCIAKFPKNTDTHNLVLWEAVALTLAKNAGINTPDWFLEKIGNKDVIIIKRFDRNGKTRIPFLSAMSMLNAVDNDEITHSYLDIADSLRQYGSSPKADLVELWKRIVFSIMISNTDDHLRNHGFLYESEMGWRLSPVYDINPNPQNAGSLTTYISQDDNSADIKLAFSVAEYFGLKNNEANFIADEIKKSVQKWVDTAKSLGLKRSEIEQMSNAFKV